MAEIIKAFRESIPAMRFIGKKYPGFGGLWDEWFANGCFSEVERRGMRIWHDENGGV